MICKVEIQINGKEIETLLVEAESRDKAITQTIRTYDEYLEKGIVKSYQIKGVI